MKRIVKERILSITAVFEIILAFFIGLGVLAGIYDLVSYIIEIARTGVVDSYVVFQSFLGHALLLVVGVELIIMLVLHTPGSIVEVLLFAIARKLLIESKTFLEVFMGVLAVGGLFAIRKYLFTKDFYPSGNYLFPADMMTDSVNEILEVNIPEKYGNTMGEVLENLARQSGEEPVPGKEYKLKGVKVQAAEVEDGKVKFVRMDLG